MKHHTRTKKSLKLETQTIRSLDLDNVRGGAGVTTNNTTCQSYVICDAPNR